MNLLRKAFAPFHILLDPGCDGKKRVFEQAGLLFENNQGWREVWYSTVCSPGAPRSTSLGQGVAIPHGRIKGRKEAVGAFVRLAQAVPSTPPTAAVKSRFRAAGARAGDRTTP